MHHSLYEFLPTISIDSDTGTIKSTSVLKLKHMFNTFTFRYLRFASHSYKESSIDDRFAHLTNNAIVKNTPDAHFDVDATMWHTDRYATYLRDTYGPSAKDERWGGPSVPYSWPHIQRQIKRLVWLSLMSVREKIVDRTNSYELFGYDFMVDAYGQVWLIEVNSSPDLSFSTSTTRKLVSQLMPEIADLVLVEEALGSAWAFQKRNPSKTSGKFTLMDPADPAYQRLGGYGGAYGEVPRSSVGPLPGRRVGGGASLSVLGHNYNGGGGGGGISGLISSGSKSSIATGVPINSSGGGGNLNPTINGGVNPLDPRGVESVFSNNFRISNGGAGAPFAGSGEGRARTSEGRREHSAMDGITNMKPRLG